MNQHNEHYMGLRARANAAGDEMARNFDAAHGAYAGGDRARAKELSNAGKAAQKEMERLNEEAAEWIFRGASVGLKAFFAGGRLVARGAETRGMGTRRKQHGER